MMEGGTELQYHEEMQDELVARDVQENMQTWTILYKTDALKWPTVQRSSAQLTFTNMQIYGA